MLGPGRGEPDDQRLDAARRRRLLPGANAAALLPSAARPARQLRGFYCVLQRLARPAVAAATWAITSIHLHSPAGLAPAWVSACKRSGAAGKAALGWLGWVPCWPIRPLLGSSFRPATKRGLPLLPLLNRPGRRPVSPPLLT